MRIPPITNKIQYNSISSQGQRFLRQQYLERFESKTKECDFFKGVVGFYHVLKNTLIMIAAYAIGLLGYELRTNNYEALNSAGVISYVEPIQKDFSTRREVFDYATERIKESLRAKEPYEHAIYINNATNEVMAEFKGDENQVHTAISFVDKLKLKILGKGATLIHGHPEYANGITPPLSHSDFETLCKNDFLTEIVAMDKDGNVSLLRKSPFFVSPDLTERDNVSNDLVVILFDSFENKDYDKFVEVISAYQQETDSVKIKEIKKELDYYILGQDSTIFTNKSVDEYWKDNASKYGLEYFSNFYKE